MNRTIASLHVSDALRDICQIPALGFHTVRHSCEQPTHSMLCMGSNMKPFSLPMGRLQTLTEKRDISPSSVEWGFANWRRSSFTSLESSDDEESTDEEMTDDSTDGPVTEEEV